MPRSNAVSVLTVALFAGLGTAAAQVAPTPTPAAQEPCPVVLGKQASVSVDGSAAADPDCLTVTKNKTTVVWTGSADVKTMTITFKDRAAKHPPDDPVCSGAQCTADKLKLGKVGAFGYGIVVVLQDGTRVTNDPKLVIQP